MPKLLLSLQDVSDVVDWWDRFGIVGVAAFLALVIAMLSFWKWLSHDGQCAVRYEGLNATLKNVDVSFKSVDRRLTSIEGKLVEESLDQAERKGYERAKREFGPS